MYHSTGSTADASMALSLLAGGFDLFLGSVVPVVIASS